MTKGGSDREPLLKLMTQGLIEFRYSCLRGRQLLDPHKGLPPPKSQRDAAAASFCSWYEECEGRLQEFLIAIGAVVAMRCRGSQSFGELRSIPQLEQVT